LNDQYLKALYYYYKLLLTHTMGGYFSSTVSHNYKHDSLMAFCNIMIGSPKKLDKMIIEKENVDIAELRQYKWMG